jgi:ADP-heptose:LPS heptosyltransferase
MQVSTMRRVDRWLGTPLCVLLTAVRQAVDVARPGRPNDERPASIVFIKLAEQGSTVLAWPAIRNAIERVGRERVFFVVFEENRPILDAVAWIPQENILAIPSDSLPAVARGALRAVRRLRRLNIGAAIDLEFFARSSAILSYLSGAPKRVGFHAYAGESGYRGDLCTHRLVFNPYLHTSQVFEELVDALDQPPGKLPAYDALPPTSRALPEFRPTQDEIETVRRMLEGGGCAGTPLILLNANASDLIPLRRWPAERYVELAARLLEKYPLASVLFTGAPSEAIATDRLVREVGSDRCVSVAGRTSFRDLLTLYTLSDVLVTNDSGPSHFAALTPIEVITLFGPETPALFAALTPRNRALWAGIVCSPCLNAFNDRQSSCSNNVCMQRLSVAEVFEEVTRAYHRRASARPTCNPGRTGSARGPSS